jgi:hypothetical protein
VELAHGEGHVTSEERQRTSKRGRERKRRFVPELCKCVWVWLMCVGRGLYARGCVYVELARGERHDIQEEKRERERGNALSV